MAFWSALSSGASSVMNMGSSLSLHDLTGGWSDYSSRKSSAKYADKLAREQASWSALNMPRLERMGLQKAGYNPLLAIGGVNTPLAQSFGMPPSTGGDSKPFSALSELYKGEVKTQKATEKNIEQSTKESESREFKNKTDAWSNIVSAVRDTGFGILGSAYGAKKLYDLFNPSKGGKPVDIPLKNVGNGGKFIMPSLLPLAGYGLGVGTSAFLGNKVIEQDKKLRKKFKDWNWKGPNPVLMGH